VDTATMDRVKIKVRASVIAQLDNNAGLASLLARHYAEYGDWRKLFTSINEIDKVTAADVQSVAATYFVKKNRTVAYTTQAPAAPGGGRRQ
jgi:predicted Zn-dependent peptidase